MSRVFLLSVHKKNVGPVTVDAVTRRVVVAMKIIQRRWGESCRRGRPTCRNPPRSCRRPSERTPAG
ncbi:hypothetical protein JCM18918_2262 [Cutibacterium acnes JCM 18918]|nr:hypothetical protein JCM18918_2262 [Cutibacterium acnes JCM 18918]